MHELGPQAIDNTLTVNFDGGGGDILTYSLGDLRACVERDDKEFFRREFAGKVVLFGTLLDVEDRKITSKRFATGRERSGAPRCALPMPPPSTIHFPRSTIAGVYIHAAAVNNLIGRDTLRELGRGSVTVIAIGFALVAAVAARALAPLSAAAAWLGMAVVWTTVATSAFAKSVVLPLSEPFAASIAALVLIIAWRLVVTDRGQRLLRNTFALYLAPQV